MGCVPEALHKALQRDIGRTKQPTDTSSAQHWAAYALQANLTKKLTGLEPSDEAKRAALEKFKAVNTLVGKYSIPSESMDTYKYLLRAKKLFAQQALDSEKDPKLNLAKAFNIGMVGPGAARLATEDDLINKLFNSSLSCTNPILHKYYLQAIANCKSWRKAERARAFQHRAFTVVKGNALFYVPKETIIARTAATEPTLNMFGQKGYGDLIEKLLLQYHNIDLEVQQNINRWFARVGSSNGEYATIDLSSASDTIGLTLLNFLLPECIMKDLMLLRSPVTEVGREVVELNMISTMGNGFTFPLETWVFANLILAVMIEDGEPIFDAYGKRRYSVFGDDIVCPVKVYDKAILVLESAGFTVNRSKSFGSGGFRESCGGDYFKGSNVRSVYLKESYNDSHVYSLINRLLDWSGVHKIPLPETCAYLRSLVQFRPIPLYEDETSGIRTPLSRLQARKKGPWGGFYYRCLVQEVPAYPVRPEFTKRNYHAVKVAFLHGDLKGDLITPRVRAGQERFKVVRREATTWWNFSTDARLTTEERCNAFELCFPMRKA